MTVGQVVAQQEKGANLPGAAPAGPAAGAIRTVVPETPLTSSEALGQTVLSQGHYGSHRGLGTAFATTGSAVHLPPVTSRVGMRTLPGHSGRPAHTGADDKTQNIQIIIREVGFNRVAGIVHVCLQS